MNKISVVIITKNEERNIKRCLNSIKNLADEIIIVDSLSEDKTVSICESFDKLTVYSKKWDGFSNTKNFANSKCNFDYILSLDADEELSEELVNSIKNLKSNKQLISGAYSFNRLTNYCGQWIHYSDWYPDVQLRLFPKENSFWSQDQVHEKIQFKNKTQVNKLLGNLNHYSYYSIREHVDRLNKYSDLGAIDVLNKKSNFLLIHGSVRSILRFFKAYFIKRGILDGKSGFIISVLTAYFVFLKYIKAHQILKDKKD